MGAPTWFPNGKRVSFVVSTSDTPTLWVADLATKSARQDSTRRLNAVLGAPCDWSGDEALDCRLVPADRERSRSRRPPRWVRSCRKHSPADTATSVSHQDSTAGGANAVTLALTLFVYYVLCYALGQTLNRALIFSIGILVDDAIAGEVPLPVVDHEGLPARAGAGALRSCRVFAKGDGRWERASLWIRTGTPSRAG